MKDLLQYSGFLNLEEFVANVKTDFKNYQDIYSYHDLKSLFKEELKDLPIYELEFLQEALHKEREILVRKQLILESLINNINCLKEYQKDKENVEKDEKKN